MDSKTKAAKILAELTEWVEMHGEQVDWTVFREECDSLLSSAFRAVAPLSAFPATSYGRGVCTLELACSLMGVRVPDSILAIDTLPGAGDYRRARSSEEG